MTSPAPTESMTATLASPGFTQDAFDEFLASRDEPDWLTTRRRDAWQTFSDAPLPSSGEEEWRRTDLRVFRLDRFGFPAPVDPDTDFPRACLAEGVDLGGRNWSLNSQPIVSELDDAIARQGVLFGSLDQHAAAHGDLIQRHLHTVVDPDYDKFVSLHAACWTGGTLLYVPRGVRVEKPLHVLSALSGGSVDLSHVLIVLEDDAEATLLLETAGDDSPGLHCGGIEVIQGARSSLRFVSLQDWGRQVWHFAHQKAVVGERARLQWTVGALGAKLAKVNQHVAMTGRDADVQVNGVMFTEDRQHLNYNTLQHHEAPSCRSDLLYKGALQDKSRIVWRGMIKVDPEAQQTAGYQRSDNLILSDAARADMIPGLEIEADDVACTHGATAGRVDDEPLFYLRCRGLTSREATRMYVAGFFQQVFDRITIETVREALAEAIGRRIRAYD